MGCEAPRRVEPVEASQVVVVPILGRPPRGAAVQPHGPEEAQHAPLLRHRLNVKPRSVNTCLSGKCPPRLMSSL